MTGQSQLVYITFDRIAGDKVYDDSGYENHGALFGLPKLARDTGKCGHGLRFQGGKMWIIACHCNVIKEFFLLLKYSQYRE